jgi:imidazoleglycerol-phosphate dehydratase
MTPTPRTAEVTRNTAETQITVKRQPRRHRPGQAATGIGFFDHMLDQIARHGLIDLDIQAKGDLHIDGHHTVEDVGITLGQAVAKAVGDKKGIRRYGHAYVPLDEALSRVVIDFSGRPGLVMNVPFKSGMIGTFDTQLAHEFFQGFVQPRLRHAAHRQPARAKTPTTSAKRCSRPSPGRCDGAGDSTRARPV